MRVVFAGGTICDYHTLQRLILVADEIAFLDSPAVVFGDWTIAGAESEFRRMGTGDAPIRFSVQAPRPAGELYLRYIRADLANPRFVRTLLEGLAQDERFRARFASLRAKYNAGTGGDLFTPLLADASLASADLGAPIDARHAFRTEGAQGRRETLKILVVEASVQVTSALAAAEAGGLIPVSDDPFLCRLIALRAGDRGYVGKSSRLSPYLGLPIAQAVIPDESVSALEIKDLFEFRRTAQDAYSAWSAEVDRLVEKVAELDPETARAALPELVDSESQPRLQRCQEEMRAARDRLFGDLVKRAAAREVPTLSVAYLAGLDIASAISAFSWPNGPNGAELSGSRSSMACLVGTTKADEAPR